METHNEKTLHCKKNTQGQSEMIKKQSWSLRNAQQEDSQGEREEPADWLPGNKLRCCVKGGGFSQASLPMILCFSMLTRSFTFLTLRISGPFLGFVFFSACEGNAPSHAKDAASSTCILLEAVGASFCIVLAPWRTPKDTADKELSLFAIALLRWSRGSENDSF